MQSADHLLNPGLFLFGGGDLPIYTCLTRRVPGSYTTVYKAKYPSILKFLRFHTRGALNVDVSCIGKGVETHCLSRAIVNAALAPAAGCRLHIKADAFLCLHNLQKTHSDC